MPSKRIHRISRRALLGGLGVSALAPFIPLLDAEAEETGIPKRMILFFHPFGTFHDQWRPSTAGAGVVNGGVTSYGAANLTYNGPITSPLEPYKDDIVLIEGVQIPYRSNQMSGDPHQAGMALLWSGSKPLDCANSSNSNCWAEGGQDGQVGWGGGITVEQHVINRLQPATPFRTLALGVDTPNSGGFNIRSAMSYTGPGEPITPQTNPLDTWQTVFGDFMGPDEDVQRRIARRHAALGLASRQLGSIRDKVSAHDRAKIESHLDHVASLQGQIDGLAASCSPPDAPPQFDDESAQFMEIGRAQIDMMVAALACDATRVASLQLKDEDGGRVNWLDPNAGVSFHGLSHKDGDWEVLMPAAYHDFTALFAYLLQRLREVPMPDGTRLLDNTLVGWGSAIAGGSHSTKNVPFALAGNCQGAIETGRYLVYEGEPVHNRLLVSMMHAMGLDNEESFGNYDDGTGPLFGL